MFPDGRMTESEVIGRMGIKFVTIWERWSGRAGRGGLTFASEPEGRKPKLARSTLADRGMELELRVGELGLGFEIQKRIGVLAGEG